MHSKVWDEITYPFLNFNGCTVEVYEWISNFIPHFIIDVITYPCFKMVHPCVWSQEGSGCPQVLSLVLGGDFERLASTLEEPDKGVDGPQRINRPGISFSLLGDSDEALPVPYKATCSVALGYISLTKLGVWVGAGAGVEGGGGLGDKGGSRIWS